MTIRKVSSSELKKVGQTGVSAAGYAPPAGISPVLRAGWAWNFARNMAQRFSQETLSDRVKQFLDNLAKKYS